MFSEVLPIEVAVYGTETSETEAHALKARSLSQVAESAAYTAHYFALFAGVFE